MESLRNYPLSLPRSDYIHPCPVLSGESIGRHVRHLLDFFTCLVDGLKTGVIDYEDRKRDSEIETHPLVAEELTNKIEQELFFHLEKGDRSLRVHVLISGQKIFSQSSLFRELTFVLDHGVHHLAMIRAGWISLGLKQVLPESFGVAETTIRFSAGENSGHSKKPS
ncbi:MAG: hypothetical protein OXB93_00200 [Cytophagales bacterium]|nr:hypothetical protein [Cytophagales bacterium]